MSRATIQPLDATASEWRAAVAPADFASRVVALALAAPAVDDDTVDDSAVDDGAVALRPGLEAWWSRLTEVRASRAKFRRAGIGLALALGVGAAAALNHGNRADREGSAPSAAPIERPPVHAAQVSQNAGSSERSVGSPAPARAHRSQSKVEPPATSPERAVPPEETPLPVRLHVPPCQCTLSAVLCSCVE